MWSPPNSVVIGLGSCLLVAAVLAQACIEVAPPDPLEGSEVPVVDGDCATPTLWYRDADGDGQGNGAQRVRACDAPPGFVDNDLDCADLDPDTRTRDEPAEVCFDGVDNDCDGVGCVVEAPLSLARISTGLFGRVENEQLGASLAAPADTHGDGRLDLGFGVDAAGMDAAVYLVSAATARTSRPLATEERLADAQTRRPATTDVCLGDVDNDGLADLVVGRTSVDGAARILLAPDFGDSTVGFDLEVAGGNTEGTHRVALADLDADGALDLAVGAPADSTGRGLVRIYYNDGTGQFTETDSAELVGADAGSQAGFALAGPCDVDGDGADDLLIGAPGSGPGAVYVLRGQPGTRLPTANLGAGVPRIVGATDGDRLGHDVACAGAVRQDGASDLVIGAPGAQDGAGAFYLLSGAFDGEVLVGPGSPGAVGSPGAALGTTVLGKFDHDGDARPDLAITAAGGMLARVFVYHGPRPPLDVALATPAFELVAAQPGDQTGASLAAGDLDGDGRDELLIGVPGASDLATSAGAVRIVPGGLF